MSKGSYLRLTSYCDFCRSRGRNALISRGLFQIASKLGTLAETSLVSGNICEPCRESLNAKSLTPIKYMVSHTLIKWGPIQLIHMNTNENGEHEESATRSVLDSIRKIVRALRVASRAAEKSTGLSGAQVFLLQKLADGGGLSIKELTAQTLTHQSSVSVVVQRLVDRKFVERTLSAVDRRRVELFLTEAGRAAISTSHDLAQDRLIGALRAMPKMQRRQLAALLDDLVARAGIYSGPAPLFFEEEIATAAREEF